MGTLAFSQNGYHSMHYLSPPCWELLSVLHIICAEVETVSHGRLPLDPKGHKLQLTSQRLALGSGEKQTKAGFLNM